METSKRLYFVILELIAKKSADSEKRLKKKTILFSPFLYIYISMFEKKDSKESGIIFHTGVPSIGFNISLASKNCFVMQETSGERTIYDARDNESDRSFKVEDL